MSKVTTIYNQILCELKDKFQDKFRIPNPYSLEDNNSNFLVNGYGVKIGSAPFEEFEFCSFVTNRSIDVVFTQEMMKVDSDTDVYDDVALKLLEDVYEVQKLFYSYNELGILEDVLKVDIVDSSEISSFKADKMNFLTMTANFNFSIRELL
jgi:hypothetical protein